MPTTIHTRHRAATRGQADDHRIARGQIALVDALTGRLAGLRDRLLGLFARSPR